MVVRTRHAACWKPGCERRERVTGAGRLARETIMTMTGLEVFDTIVQKTNEWLSDVMG